MEDIKSILFKDGIQLVSQYKAGKYRFIVNSKGTIFSLKELKESKVHVSCFDCGITTLNIFQQHYLNKAMKCLSCSKKGTKIGIENHMYGVSLYSIWLSKYGKEKADIKLELYKNKMSSLFVGNKNPMYGKRISLESEEKRKITLQKYTKEDYIERSFKNSTLTLDLLKEYLNKYKNKEVVGYSFYKSLGIDFRTFKKYVLYFDIVSEDELKEICWGHKSKNFVSASEKEFVEFLKINFPSSNIKTQIKLGGYIFDVLLDNKLIIEYDGYYWHQNTQEKDGIKDKVAKDKGFQIYRVKENIKRKINKDIEIENIKKVYYDI